MTDFPELPAFLNRKVNGIVTNPASYTGRRIVERKRRRRHKLPADAVRVYIRSKIRGLSPGWHYVSPTIGRKWVRMLPVGKTRGVRISRAVWDSMRKEVK